MSFFGGRSYSYTEGAGRSHRGHSPARSTRSTGSKSGGYYSRPSAKRSSSSSFFGGGGNYGYNNRSSSSFFGNLGGLGGYGGSSSRGFGGWGGGSSHYKRSPRQGYISYLMHKLQRMLRELWYYAKRHPMKAFFAVVLPLLSAGGAIGGLLRQFGIRMPMHGFGTSRGGGGYYGSSGYGSDRDGGGFMDKLGPVMQIARAFT